MTNKYFLNYIGKQFMLLLLIFMGFSVLNPMLNLVFGVKGQRHYFFPQVKDNVYFALIIMTIVLGVFYSQRGFRLLMNVYPHRKRYLAMLFITGPVQCFLAVGVAQIFRSITRLIEQRVTGEVVEGMYFSTLSFFGIWVMFIFTLVVGLFIGALFYRFRWMTALGMLLILPIWLGASAAGYFASEGSLAAFNLYWGIQLLRSVLDWKWQLIYSLLGSILTYLLLYKAPVGQYAHDLA